ncbi:MAG: hypothetical protein IPM06_20070 [Rhizobiales bacterium]|nr:hypothetical protein [Hyphomicrobiales bacterium]
MLDTEPSRIEGAVLVYIVTLCAISMACGYLVGYTRGEALGERTNVVTKIEVAEYPPAYAAVCAEMLEAAWTLREPDWPEPATSPHEP